MSRLAKKPISFPAKTEITFDNGLITVKGPLGTLTRTLPDRAQVNIGGNELTLALPTIEGKVPALLGTFFAHIKNMINGVHTPYERKLIVEGIGYKADVKGKELHMALGFSHPVIVAIPEGLKVVSEKNIVTISGIDRDKVGSFSAQVRNYKKPEPYKGKGVRYSDEVIRRKQGKKAA